MSAIEPIVCHISQFTVAGFSVRTKNSDEFNPETAKIPSLWQKFNTSIIANAPCVYGVYSDYESDVNGFYTLTVGVSESSEQAGFSRITIAHGNYLVFKGTGAMPEAVVTAWKQIWEFFASNLHYQRSFISDFEAYTSAGQVEIYIGIVS
ncbi:GyrI-like domain-containing protein [Legionella dresdenensis]|uniref:GyrI-like domain-containing protein n=1 Tax=Legionella dresdenensis TaxID=450200 RepID=A0ABV8CFE8_9GAMM